MSESVREWAARGRSSSSSGGSGSSGGGTAAAVTYASTTKVKKVAHAVDVFALPFTHSQNSDA